MAGGGGPALVILGGQVELRLWRALAKTVTRWAARRKSATALGERDGWREGLVRALTASALAIAPNHGSNGPRQEVESGLDQAFRQVVRRYSYDN